MCFGKKLGKKSLYRGLYKHMLHAVWKDRENWHFLQFYIENVFWVKYSVPKQRLKIHAWVLVAADSHKESKGLTVDLKACLPLLGHNQQDHAGHSNTHEHRWVALLWYRPKRTEPLRHLGTMSLPCEDSLYKIGVVFRVWGWGLHWYTIMSRVELGAGRSMFLCLYLLCLLALNAFWLFLW